MLHIVTYATHSKGLYEQLVNNRFGTHIVTLGWNKPWTGYSDKPRGLLEYISNLVDSDIVIFIDGWDTIINKDPSQAKKLFEKCKCDILVSKHYGYWSGGNGYNTVYSACKNNTVANSGMFMGRVGALKELLNKMLSLKCVEDQVSMNQVCSEIDLKLDHDNVIFQNTYPNNKNLTGIFVSYPGSGNGRYIRGIYDYTQFYETYIMLGLLMLILAFPKYRNVLIIMSYAMIIYHFTQNDRSCV